MPVPNGLTETAFLIWILNNEQKFFRQREESFSGKRAKVQAYLILLCLALLYFIDVVFFTNWRKGPPPQAKKQTNEQKTWLLRTNPTRVYCQDSLYWWSGTKPTISSRETRAHAWVYVPADRLCARHLREGLDTSISTRTLHVPSHKHICHLPVSNPCPTHTAFDSW